MNEPGLADPARRVEQRSRRPALSAGLVALVLAALAAGVLAVTVLPTLITHPSFVARVSVTNPSDYDVNVFASKEGAATEVALGAAGQQCTTTFEQVADQGEHWVFRFEAQGTPAATITVDRASLEAARWTVAVPDDATQRLAEADVPLPPHRDCGNTPPTP
jgi:hypothetical protein